MRQDNLNNSDKKLATLCTNCIYDDLKKNLAKFYPQYNAFIGKLDKSYTFTPFCSNSEQLSKREIECLYWIAQGKTAEEIAIILSISVRTVENHRRHVLEKLHASNTAHAVFKAMRMGYLPVFCKIEHGETIKNPDSIFIDLLLNCISHICNNNTE